MSDLTEDAMRRLYTNRELHEFEEALKCVSGDILVEPDLELLRRVRYVTGDRTRCATGPALDAWAEQYGLKRRTK